MTGKKPHIVLIGFMGAGKTTIGKMLASELDFKFVDLDSEIEAKTKKTISEIFTDDGETYFRQIESEMLDSWLSHEDSCVISTGGGAPAFYDGIKKINKSDAFSVYLKLGINKLVNRLNSNKIRPLLKQKSGTTLYNYIQKLLRERVLVYGMAKKTIMAHRKPVLVTNTILKSYRKFVNES